MVIYMKDVVNSPLHVAFLLSAKTIATMFFEIPTGFVADRAGRKTSVLIGLGLTVISLILFVSHTAFPILVLAQVLFGIAETFDSGAYTALLHDNLEASGEGERFDETLRGLSFWSSVSLFTAFIVGSFAYDSHFAIPFVASAAAAILAVLVLLFIDEKPHAQEKHPGEAGSPKSLLRRILGESKTHMGFLMASNTVGAVFYAAYLLMIPLLFEGSGLPIAHFGWVFAIGVLSFGYGAKLSGNLSSSMPFLKFTSPLAAAGLFAALAYTPTVFVVVPLFFAMRILWGAYSVTLGIELNKRIKDSTTRATVLSVASAIEGGLATVLMIALGAFMRATSLHATGLLIAALFCAASASFTLVSDRSAAP
ncbi:MAG: hypothetical protein AUJ52_09520 [Elusimicrobia bacterium CG1_02_63_36]|nr:MAG: hypothetical protein AUJ52_09520 [Elusimicrobia bacterium CG1_02_63_36]